MTQKTYNVAQSFMHAGRWYHEGEKFPPENVKVDDALIERYKGIYLLDDKELARLTNPQAYDVTLGLEAAQARIRELEAQLAGRDPVDVTPLLELFKNEDGSLPTFAEAVQAAQQAQADAESNMDDEAAAELDAYRSAVGELLPAGLNANAARSLRARGFVGKRLIARIPDAELNALDHVADKSIETLRTWAPFEGQTAEPAGPLVPDSETTPAS